MSISVSGTVIMDEMNVLQGEGTADDPRVLMRDPLGWRAAVFGRLGTTVIKTTFIEQHQMQEPATSRKKLGIFEEKSRLFLVFESHQIPRQQEEELQSERVQLQPASQQHCPRDQSCFLSCGMSG